jgi:hypothetical protein
VVAVFTKMDALDSEAFNELLDQNVPRGQAKQRAPEHSLSIVKGQYLSQLLAMRYPPKGNVYMRGKITRLATYSNTLTGST